MLTDSQKAWMKKNWPYLAGGWVALILVLTAVMTTCTGVH